MILRVVVAGVGGYLLGPPILDVAYGFSATHKSMAREDGSSGPMDILAKATAHAKYDKTAQVVTAVAIFGVLYLTGVLK